MNDKKFKVIYQLKKVEPTFSDVFISSETYVEIMSSNDFREIFIDLCDKHLEDSISGIEIISVEKINKKELVEID